jgi:tetratricopeptide (TPR) repeat protein
LSSGGVAISNISIRVPVHFMGRARSLAAIATAFKRDRGMVAIVALHGLRGVGKTVLAATYAALYRGDYRATWWIRAQSDSAIRSDLVGLGVRLGWVDARKEEALALPEVIERLNREGEGILLIYDNAISADVLRRYLPLSGRTHVLVTANAHLWGALATPVQIKPWPNNIGADYLIARTGRDPEYAAALRLSEILGGLPLAHEQAAAYCERLQIRLAEYVQRFEVESKPLLDDAVDAPVDYYDKRTVAKTFSLAIEEAARLDDAVESLMMYAAVLPAEPIPLYLFKEAPMAFSEPTASKFSDERLEDAVSVLLSFALIDRESVDDERSPTISTDCIRLHRLVRQTVIARLEKNELEAANRSMIKALVVAYPHDGYDEPKAWQRARRLDPLALEVVSQEVPLGAEEEIIALLDRLANYRHGALAAYDSAFLLFQQALKLSEISYGTEHPKTAEILNNIGLLLWTQGHLAEARLTLLSALSKCEAALGAEHSDTALYLNNLGLVVQHLGDFSAAQVVYQRALAIREKLYGPEHPDVAQSLGNLGFLFSEQGRLVDAKLLQVRALAIREKMLGSDHPVTAFSLNNLGAVLQMERDFVGAQALHKRALAIREKTLGSNHPAVAQSLHNLGEVFEAQGHLPLAQHTYERALAIREAARGLEDPSTNLTRSSLARLLLAIGDPAESLRLGLFALAAHEKTLGATHRWTNSSARVAVKALQALGRDDEADIICRKFGIRIDERSTL